MKNVIRNDLWMMIVAWCLILNGYSIWGLVTALLSSIYLLPNTYNKNFWRLLAVGLICFSLSYLLAKNTLIGLFKYFTFFMILTSLNVALLNERLQYERIKRIYLVFAICFVVMFIFMLTGVILPSAKVLCLDKTVLFALIIEIFIPFTFELGVNLAIKEFNKKKMIDRLNVKTKTLL